MARAYEFRYGKMTDLSALAAGFSSDTNWVSPSGLISGEAQTGETADPSIGGWTMHSILWERGHMIDLGVPFMPLSHPFVERLIGTLRRECLDRTIFRTTTDVQAKLRDFQHYYNEHLSCHRWQKHCRGLYQTPIAADFGNLPPTGATPPGMIDVWGLTTV